MATEPVSSLNLFQRINEIRRKVDYIKKDKSVSTGGGGSYQAVTHDAVTAILRQYMVEFGVVCVPTLVTSKANDFRNAEAKQFRYDATYAFEFVNCDRPEERLTITLEAHSMDNADKAPGKALSYAKKYAVLKLFEIETGENEEGRYPYEPEEPESKPERKSVKQPKAKAAKESPIVVEGNREQSSPQPAESRDPAEVGEINFLKAKFSALRQSTPSDVLVEAGCGELDPDTLAGLSKQQFAAIKAALRTAK